MTSEREIDIDVLISLVEDFPVIWNKSSEEYKDRNKTRDAWREICIKLDGNFDQLDAVERKEFGTLVLKRWTNIRDQWIKWKKRVNDVKKSGAGASKIRKYIYSEQLKFLEKIPTHRPTESNIPNEGEEQHESENDSQQNTNQATGTPATEVAPEKTTTKRRDGAHRVTQGANKKRRMDEFELRMLKSLESDQPQDRHLLFFKGVLPSIQGFNDSQTIDFQMGILQLVKNIKSGNPHLPAVNQQMPLYRTTLHNPYPPAHPLPQQHFIPGTQDNSQATAFNNTQTQSNMLTAATTHYQEEYTRQTSTPLSTEAGTPSSLSSFLDMDF